MIKLKVYVPQDGPYGLVPKEGGKVGMTHFHISHLYSKWYKSWLKLAEKFKEAKEETKKNRAVRDASQFLENFNRRKK